MGPTKIMNLRNVPYVTACAKPQQKVVVREDAQRLINAATPYTISAPEQESWKSNS
jgi:hypothetical protein